MKALGLSRDILKKEAIVEGTSAKIFALSSFVILTALGAYVRIPLPFTPVPITLQTFFVLLSGAVLGKKWGAASQAGYLSLGLIGLPIFSGANAGAAYLFGPTGGYIIGFIISSWVVGEMIHQGNHQNLAWVIFAMITGSLIGIYLFGLLGLSLFLKCKFSQALRLGLFPFIAGDIIKIIAASLIFCKIEKRCGEIFGPLK